MKNFIDNQMNLISKLKDKLAGIKLANSVLKQTPNDANIISIKVQLIKEYWDLKHDFYNEGLPKEDKNEIKHGSVWLCENYFNNDS